MTYAVPCDMPLVTSKLLVHKRERSASSEYVAEWCRTHTVSLSIDKETGVGMVSAQEIPDE